MMDFTKLKWLIFIFFVSGGVNLMSLEVSSKGVCKIEGKEYPAIGFGTYPLKEDVCLKAVSQACNLGYRIIDTATFYKNFRPIGNALITSGLNREEFYIISKVWPDSQTPKKLKEDLRKTLKELQISYLDAYLLHWPNSKISIQDTLEAMNELRKDGLIRHIGLSNVNVNHLRRALEANIPITWVQVEMHPYFYDAELTKFCQENSIGIQAWGPLGRGRLSEDSFLKELGKKYNKTASQIALKWILQHQCIPLPGSKNQEHMKQNLQISDFVLSNEDMEKINQRATKGRRERVTKEAGVGFTDEFDFSYEECWPN